MFARSPSFLTTRQKAPAQRPAHRYYLSIAAIAFNEGPYLAEWVQFHLSVGVDHIFLYDNDSTDETRDVLRPYETGGSVTRIRWPHWDRSIKRKHCQNTAYGHALIDDQEPSRWMAFIDIDEFLFSPAERHLPTLFRSYEDLPAIAAYWTIFGTSGHATRPTGGVIESYTRSVAPDRARQLKDFALFKSVVQPDLTFGVISSHCFQTVASPVLAYNERREPIRQVGPEQFSNETLRLNHYYTKSVDEFYRNKIPVHANGWRKKAATFFEERYKVIEAATVDDFVLRDFVHRHGIA